MDKLIKYLSVIFVIPLTVRVVPFCFKSKGLWLITVHPTSIPSLIGSALIVSTDDHTSTDILLVVTDISLSWLLGSVTELPCTVQDNKSPIPTQVKLANV